MRIAYYRVSSGDQSIAAQRHEMGGSFDREFSDEGLSGLTMAAARPGFAKAAEHLRPGDTLFVYAVDRLGRDALEIQSTVRQLLNAGVGEIILAVLAQVADLELRRIRERAAAGRATARAALAATGRTHRGKESLGRPHKADQARVIAWRRDNKASIKATALQFDISEATVKRYCSRELV
jgi:putative DNA-invertase from lambdoid prophage Rac